MRLCEHYRKVVCSTEEEVECEPAYNSWNAFIVYPSGYADFRTGFFTEYLEHLSENPECARVAGVTPEWAKARLREIEEEFEAFMQR